MQLLKWRWVLYVFPACLGILLLTSCTIEITSPTSFGQTLEEEAAPNWTPDNQHLVMECYLDGPTEKIAESNLYYFTEEAADICVIKIDGQNRIRLTEEQGQDRYPIWSPDGAWIAYIRYDGLYIIKPDGSNRNQLVPHTNALEQIEDVSWSPEGTHLLFSGRFGDLNRDIYLVNIKTGTLTNLTENDDLQDFSPRWVEDGLKVVYLSNKAHWYELSPAKLKIMKMDGSNKQVKYDEEIFYTFFSVLDEGQIIFTTYDLSEDDLEHLYIMNLKDTKPVEIAVTSRWSALSLSPNGQHLIYQKDVILEMMETRTGKISKLPLEVGNILGTPSWSSDSRQVAFTSTGFTLDLFYNEKHIYILDLQKGTIRQLIPH